MNKNKEMFLTLVIMFNIILAGIGSFYLGRHFGYKVEIKKESEIQTNELNNLFFTNEVNRVLYNFLQSKENNLKNYLDNLSNSQKLYLAGIISYDGLETDLDNKKLENLKNNLVKYFGDDLKVSGQDYYAMEQDEEPVFKYDAKTDSFVYNENVIGSDVITSFELGFVYNYKLDNIVYNKDGFAVTYYGLYGLEDEIGPTTLTNDKDIERILNYTDDGMSDDAYLEYQFNNNRKGFLKFTYYYKKVNDKYVLTDFKQA
mgnify:FL=1